MQVLEYKGYHAKIEYDADSEVLHGIVAGINDYVDFQCDDAKGVVKEFHQAVDDYLAFCQELGKVPDKEYKGRFNVRIDPQIHRQLATYAHKAGKSLNAVVEEAAAKYISQVQA